MSGSCKRLTRGISLASRSTCASQCLDIILSLHEERILERLGLSTTSDPKRPRWKSTVSISTRLNKMIEDIPIELPESCSHATRTALLNDLGSLRSAILALELATSSRLATVRRVVESAARIARPKESLRSKLMAIGFPLDIYGRKEIRQIRRLANYVHGCNYLSGAARLYRRQLSTLSLTLIEPYAKEIWPLGSSKKHFVHAEIQLLVHHGMRNSVRMPRYIGVSKRACFLCSCFMRAYGKYTLPETHGEVHPQWTIPDRNDLSKNFRKKLRAALFATSSDVKIALAKAQGTKTRLAPQVQSPAHSVVASLMKASASTR